MAVILALSANVPSIATWRPLYLLLTVIIVFSQKVDTTLSKGVLRFVASVLGGAYGKGCAHASMFFCLVLEQCPNLVVLFIVLASDTQDCHCTW